MISKRLSKKILWLLFSLIAVLVYDQLEPLLIPVLGGGPVGVRLVETTGIVTAVVDGDTIKLATGETVRYIGVDTPETKHPTKAVECFGEAATDYNTQLVLGQPVRLVADFSEVDRYGRLLRYVYLQNGTFVNQDLVEKGYAYAASYPPDISFSQEFAAAQAEAREAKRGLWSACPDK